MPSDESGLHPKVPNSTLTHQEYTLKSKWPIKQLLLMGAILATIVLLGISVVVPEIRQYVLYPILIYAGCKGVDKIIDHIKKNKDEKN